MFETQQNAYRNFATIMVIPLNCLHFNIILSFRKRWWSRGIKCGRQWQYTDSNFVLSHKFMHRQNKNTCIVLMERPISSVPFFTWFFTTHFSTDVVLFQCDNASLQFVLAQQFRNKHPCERQKGSELALHIWAKPVLPFWDTDMMDSTTENCCLVSASYPSLRISSPAIISEWNFGSLSSMAHVLTGLFRYSLTYLLTYLLHGAESFLRS